MSSKQRPSRVTPSKKQLAQGGSKGASGRTSRRAPAKDTLGTSSDKGKGKDQPSGTGRASGSTSSESLGADASRAKGRVTEAAPARPGLLARLLPPRPEPAERSSGGDDTDEAVEGAAGGRVEHADGRRYGAGALLLVFLGAQLLASLAYGLILPQTSYDPTAVTGLGGRVGEAVVQYGNGTEPMAISQPVPLWLSTLLQVPLWGALILGPIWCATKRGRGAIADLGLRMKRIDVPIGLAIGVAAQLLMVRGLYWLVFQVIGDQDVSAAARALTDRAVDPISIVLVFVIVGIGAPIAEEIYFRGMALPIFGRRLRARWAIFASAAFFAATHFQPLQFPALLLFGIILGVLTVRSGRLGPALWAHVGFNLTAASSLLFGWFLW